MSLPSLVLITFAAVRAELGSAFSLDDLCSYTQQMRGKPIIFAEEDLPTKIIGVCIPLADVDLILTRRQLDSVLLLATKLHEIAHLLLGHMRRAAYDEQTLTYAEYCASEADATGIAHELQRRSKQEHEAESLAMLIMGSVFAYQHHTPLYAEHLYGHSR